MSDPTSNVTLTKEELAWLIKAIVESLEVPDWTKDDLIEFGKMIWAKTSLKTLAERNEKLFNRLFPLLAKVATYLGTKIATVQVSAPPTSTTTPPTPADPIPVSAPPPDISLVTPPTVSPKTPSVPPES